MPDVCVPVHGFKTRGVQRVAGVKHDLFADGVLGEARVLGDPGGAFGPHGDGAADLGAAGLPEHRVQQRALAGAAGPVQHVGLPGPQLEVDVAQHRFAPAGVAHREVADLQHGSGRGAPTRRGPGPGRGRTRGASVDDFPAALQGLDPVLGGMVGGAELAQRQVGLGGKDQGQQARLEPHVPVDQADADEHRDHGHRNGRDELQRQAGEERGAQRLHAAFAVPVGHLRQSAPLAPGAAQADQRRQPLGEFQQLVREPVEARGRRLDPVLGVQPDQDHEDRHQRQGQHDHQCRDPVGHQHAHHHHERDDGCRDKRRQVLRVVVVQPVQAAAGQCGKRPVLGAGAPTGPGEPGGHQASAQLLLGPQPGPAGGELGAPHRPRAQQRPGQARGQQPFHVGAPGARQLGDGGGQGVGDEDQPDPLERRQPGQQRQHHA